MAIRRGMSVIGVAVVLIVCSAMPALSQQKSKPESGEGFDNQVCKTGNAGMHQIKLCVSRNGNVHTVAFPATSDHMYNEGYAVCYQPLYGSATVAWDNAFASVGWGTATANSTTFPLTVTRNSTDGVLRLTQKFTWDAAQKELNIEVQLKNLTGSPVYLSGLARYFDADINAASDTYSRTSLSVMAEYSSSSPGIALSGLSDNVHTVVDYANIVPNVCAASGVGTPAYGDMYGRIWVGGWWLPAQALEVVKFQYHIY